MEAGIVMNGQIVLCKGVNDGKELEFSIKELMKYLPNLESVSVVPVGLSKYREGLYPLEPFQKEDACEVIDVIERYQKECFEKYGLHFIHASDEWYILAERPFPKEETYDGYIQLENGVGMMRLLETEFVEALENKVIAKEHKLRTDAGKLRDNSTSVKVRTVSVATGVLAYPQICSMAKRMEEKFEGLKVNVYKILNHFFGETITVSGLITGSDLMEQLADKELGECLHLPSNILRSGEDVFLDDVTLEQLGNSLQIPINIVKSSGADFVEALLGNDNTASSLNGNFVYIDAYPDR